MRQKTINLRNQGSFDKKIDFFPQTLSHIPRWVRFVQKTRAKNSHAWAPLTNFLILGQSVENATCHQVVGSADINGKVAKKLFQ
jgi:hypothetical protein